MSGLLPMRVVWRTLMTTVAELEVLMTVLQASKVLMLQLPVVLVLKLPLVLMSVNLHVGKCRLLESDD